jgi:hypothetical protein
VSIFSRAKTHSAYWPAAFVVAAFTLPVIASSAGYADSTLIVGGCVGAPGAINCVAKIGPAGDPYIRTVPQPETEVDKERAAARDRRWIDRCHPTIAQDRYGVPRYHYAAAGCEFGVIE